MIAASYQLTNMWRGLGEVGHIVLAVIVASLIVIAVVALIRR